MATTGSSSRRYSPEVKERAVRMVLETRERSGVRHGAVNHIARQLGISRENLRRWVNQAEAAREGTPAADQARIRMLEKQNEELRRSNEILKAAALFFQAELDRPQPR